jgi:C4-dicarboxylate transporter, DctM subunit
MSGIGTALGAIDEFFRTLGQRVTHAVRTLSRGPLLGAVFAIVLALTGVAVVVGAVWTRLDRWVGKLERVLIVAATLGMTALVFNTYLIEQASIFTGKGGATQPGTPAPGGDGATPGSEPAAPAPEPGLSPGAPAEAQAAAPTASPGKVRVLLTGDATTVTLQSDAGTFDVPGEIDPGAYAATASFPGYDAPLEAGDLDLSTPGLVELKCDSFAESCRARKPSQEALDAASTAPAAPAAQPASAGDPLAVAEGKVRVLLTGDATKVALTSDAGTFDVPGEIDPGAYAATASFPGYDAPLEAGDFDLSTPGLIELKCDSFAESCRARKPSREALDAAGGARAPAPSAPTPAISAPAGSPVQVAVRGGGSNHRAVGAETHAIPGLVPPGSYVLQVDFPTRPDASAGSLLVTPGADTIGIWCSDRTWQCLPDRGWWNPWAGEGQINFALMLMVALGFLGASIATQDRNHLAVDAIDRVLSPAPARLVKRLTSAVAAGFSALMALATWDLITAPESSGDTFPGAKVWWWMVEPINLLTNLMPGDSFGPGGDYPTRSAWETAMIEQGAEWPFGTAYGTVSIGSAFPLWIPLLLLLFAFVVMAIRFGALALRPPFPEAPLIPKRPRAGTRKPADVILAGAFPGALIAMGLAVVLGQGWMIVISALLLVFMGAPLFIGIGVGTLAGWMLVQETSATSLVNDMFEATKKQEIIAIPFFVLAGNLMTNGSIARRLIDFARAVVGPVPGGLGVAGVVACAIFAAISGSSPATVIAIGSILFPMLVKQGYSERFGLGLLTTAGGLGIIIPPSVPMIIFAVMVSNPGGIVGVVSPTELFLGGFAPGALIAGALIVYTMWVNWPRPGAEAGPLKPGEDPDDTLTGRYAHDLWTTFIRGIAALMLPVLVLGGIYGHMFGSPFTLDVTQAAAFAVVYALVVELTVHRELKFTDVPRVCIETASMIGSLFLILVIAISLNKLLAELEVPQLAAEAMLAWADDPLTFLILVNLFLLALGTVMDIVSAILIVAPLLAPIAAQYGIHPIHFGIMFIVNLELGYLTPPMGINLFVASTTFKRDLVKVIQGVVPFLALMLVCLAAIIWIPRWSHAWLIPIPGLPALIETQLGAATVDGPRRPIEVGRRARLDMASLRKCSPKDLPSRGTAVITFTIDADGTVSEAAVVDDALHGADAGDCLVRAVRAFAFAPLSDPSGGASRVRLPILQLP